jgi:hypothetical protein
MEHFFVLTLLRGSLCLEGENETEKDSESFLNISLWFLLQTYYCLMGHHTIDQTVAVLVPVPDKLLFLKHIKYPLTGAWYRYWHLQSYKLGTARHKVAPLDM